jgi:hypothetical protein
MNSFAVDNLVNTDSTDLIPKHGRGYPDWTDLDPQKLECPIHPQRAFHPMSSRPHVFSCLSHPLPICCCCLLSFLGRRPPPPCHRQQQQQQRHPYSRRRSCAIHLSMRGGLTGWLTGQGGDEDGRSASRPAHIVLACSRRIGFSALAGSAGCGGLDGFETGMDGYHGWLASNTKHASMQASTHRYPFFVCCRRCPRSDISMGAH